MSFVFLLLQVFILCISSAYSPLAYAQANSFQQQSVTETHRVLVVPVNLRGQRQVLLDHDQILQALFGKEHSVAARYRNISYGKIQFVGSDSDITEPISLDEPEDLCKSGLGKIDKEAVAELQRRGIPVDNYNHLIFVLPEDISCWWTGIGLIGGDKVWVKATTVRALQHELGHNLGMDHAINWENSHAEGSDFMGSGSSSLNAPHVVEMGWLQNYPEKVFELKQPGDITLAALDTDPRQSALPMIVVIRPTPGGHTYYLSYRASNSENPLSEDFTRGINIHIFDRIGRTAGLTYFVKSLADGETYTDGPMIIHQQSHVTGTQATFHISFTGTTPAMPAGPPAAPLGTIQSETSGKCLDLPGGKISDRTNVIQYSCHGGANQQWRVEPVSNVGSRIVSYLSGKCLGVDPNVQAPGGEVFQSQCADVAEQRWFIRQVNGGYVFQNVSNHLCLDVPGASHADGKTLISWRCNDGPNQVWRYAFPADL